MKTKIVKQSELTADCLLIQLFDGLNQCEKCEYKNTDDCGGGETLEKLKRKRKRK